MKISFTIKNKWILIYIPTDRLSVGIILINNNTTDRIIIYLLYLPTDRLSVGKSVYIYRDGRQCSSLSLPLFSFLLRFSLLLFSNLLQIFTKSPHFRTKSKVEQQGTRILLQFRVCSVHFLVQG